MAMVTGAPTSVDTLVTGVTIVTMNPAREVITDGAIAIAGSRIVAVGKAAEVEPVVVAASRLHLDGFVAMPGLVNAHVHITGEPLTKGFVPDDTDFAENVFEWLVPLYASHGEEDERVSAQLCAAEMLRTGTTTFLEAGTTRFTDAVAESLATIGIRARIGRWTWDLPADPAEFRQTTDEAIESLERILTGYTDIAGGRVRGTAILLGHTTCSDELWLAAKALADQHGVGLSAHMSPDEMDPTGFLERTGNRPAIHLAELGVLDHKVALTHMVKCSDSEVDALARTGASVVHCPTTALKGAYGATAVGKFPEMAAAGVNIALGTDGANASNAADLMRAAFVVAGIYKDSRLDVSLFNAEHCLEMATLAGAQALGLADEIGSLEPGKKADIVLHDTQRPEWQPLYNVPAQLVWSADGRSVHTVFVDGVKVVEDHRLLTADEPTLYEQANKLGREVIDRSGLPLRRRWPVR